MPRKKGKALHRRGWNDLSLKDQRRRLKAVEVLSKVRRGKGSLTAISRDVGISPAAVRRATGAYRKPAGRWVPTKTDSVERPLTIIEDGQKQDIIVKGSKAANLLSRHAAATRHYHQTGDSKPLQRFQGRMVKDAAGNVHQLDADPESVKMLFMRQESDFGAFADIYQELEEADA